jgi:hypothetical protein
MSLFPADWLSRGIMTAESVAAFTGYAERDPGRPARGWRWLAVRDFLEENEPLTADQCRAVFDLGEADADWNLGTATMCCAVYQRWCPAEVIRRAARSDRPAVRRAAAIRHGVDGSAEE